PRVHDDQHVSQAVGCIRRRIPGAAGPLDRPGDRPARREAAAPHQPDMSSRACPPERAARRWVLGARVLGASVLVLGAWCFGAWCSVLGAASGPARAELKGGDALVRVYDYILDA